MPDTADKPRPHPPPVGADAGSGFLAQHRKNLIILGLVTLAASGNTLWNEFVYDDILLIVEDPRVHSLGRIDRIVFTTYWGETGPSHVYRPLVLLSFAVQYALAGARPFTYHAFNLLLHLGTVLLAYGLIARLSARRELALGAALLFAAHPIHVEAVSGIVGRAELMVALATLAGLMIFADRLDADGDARSAKNDPAQLWIAGLFLLGLCAKENAIAIPLLLGLLALIFAPTANILEILRRHVRLLAMLLIACGIYFALRGYTAGRLFSLSEPSTPIYHNPLFNLHWPERLWGILRVTGIYLWHLFWPLRLSPDYSYNAIPLDFAPLPRTLEIAAWKSFLLDNRDVWLSGAALLFFAVVMCAKNAAGRDTRFFLWFAAICWLPISNLFVLTGTIMGDRLMYRPSLSFCYLAAWCIFHFCGERRRIAAWLLLGALTLAYGGRSIWYNAKWRDQRTLFEYAVAVYPESFQNQYVLGNCHLPRDPETALKHYRQAHQLAPLEPLVANNLGLALLQLGRPREAEPYFLRALQTRPDWAYPHFNLGRVYQELNRPAEASAHYHEAITLDPALIPSFRQQLANPQYLTK